jgi:signal transduction histidine kinase
VKHSNASDALLILQRQERTLWMHFSDNGTGIDAAPPNRRDGVGLLGIGQRVKMMGGTYQIETAVGTGTRISIRIPFEAAE